MKKIFIDGGAGTTGLRIAERLSSRSDIELITLSEEDRKNIDARKKALNSCDVAFLCLPDAAAIEAVSLIDNPDVTVIDASTAHRTNDGWCYGFPELSDDIAKKLSKSKRIAVPGCHASGFISLVYPLIEAGIIGNDARLTCHSITGYSGGGKKMIAEYENQDRPLTFEETAEVKSKYPNITKIKLELNGNYENGAVVGRKNLSEKDLFVEFYKCKFGNEPDEDILSAYLEIMSEE